MFQAECVNFDLQKVTDVALIPTTGHWDEYVQSWSKGHRKGMDRVWRKLNALGETRFHLSQPKSLAELHEVLRAGFEVEDKSWKGAEGTSVLKNPDRWEFFVKQAELLWESGELSLAFLLHQDQPIAFEYGMTSKGVYSSLKVGYDSAFSQFSPGQLLMMKLLEHCYADEQVISMDCLGEINQATQRWLPETYTPSID